MATARREGGRRVAATALPVFVGLLCLAPDAAAERPVRMPVRCPERPSCEVDLVGRWLLIAVEGEDLAERGRAIVDLAGCAGDERAAAGLERLRGAASEPLVRTWADAALVRLCDDPTELARLSQRAGADPALLRPLRTRWRELLAGEDAPGTEDLLVATAASHELRTVLLPELLGRGARELVAASLGTPDDTARGIAAGCLATLGQRERSGVALHLLVALRFEPFARRVPWEGGALFVPSLPWTRGEARQLVGDLVAWYVWCEREGRPEDRRRLQIVLQSVGLAQLAGYSPQGDGAEAWLTAWGRAAGRMEVERILAEQGIEHEPRWRAVLATLGK